MTMDAGAGQQARVLCALYRRYLFRLAASPFAYVCAAVLVVFSALHFFVAQQFFTGRGASGLHRFFSAMPYACILVLPAMAAIVPFGAEDRAAPGAPPVPPLAKVLALATAVGVPLLLTAAVPAAASVFGDVDAALAACAYAGTALYLLAAIAATVFFFTLIPRTGAAFIVSSLALAAADSLHLVPLYADAAPWLSAACRSLSFAWHFDAAGKGIIDTRDVSFYVAAAAFFTLATAWLEERRRGNRSTPFRRVSALAAAACALLAADGARLYVRVDVTRGRQFTVSAYSRALLAEVEEPLSITYYRSAALRRLYPQVRDVEDFLRAYAGESRQVSLTVEDPARASGGEDMEQRLEGYGIPGRQLQTAGRGTASFTRVWAAVVVDYLGGTETIPFVLSAATLEYDLTSRVQALVRGTRRMAQVAVGNGLSLDDDYGYVAPWLESQGFSVARTLLPSQAGGQGAFTLLPRVPLVLLGTSACTDGDIHALEDFIAAGGRAFIATAPYTVDVAGEWDVIPSGDGAAYMLQDFGIYFRSSTLTADASNFRLTLLSRESSSRLNAEARTELVSYALWPLLPAQGHAPQGMTAFWPCAIGFDPQVAADAGFEPSAWLSTGPSAWQYGRTGGRFVTNPFAIPRAPQPGDEAGQFAVAVALTREGEDAPSVVALGDQYALHSSMLAYSSSGAELDTRSLNVLGDALLAMGGESAILALKERGAGNSSLYKVPDEDLPFAAGAAIAATCLLPCLLLAALAAGVAAARGRHRRRRRHTRKEVRV